MGTAIDELQEEHEALLQFLYAAPVGLVQTNLIGDVQLINPLSAQLLMPIVTAGDLTNLFDVFNSVAPELRSMAATFPHTKGSICEGLRIQLTAGILGRQDPKILGFSLMKIAPDRLMAVITDMTKVIAQERQLKHSVAMFEAIVTGVTDYALMTLDREGRIESWNTSIERVTGFLAEEDIGKSFSIFYPAGTISADRVSDYLKEADADGWILDDGWRLKSGGEKFWGSSIITPLQDEIDEVANKNFRNENGNHHYALILRDITDKHMEADEYLRTIFSDHLTGISNRRAFFEAAALELKRWRRHPRPLCVMTIDADHFKRVNDTYGHTAGDEVLRNLASVLKNTTRDIDVVARIGGEEFAVLLPSTEIQNAYLIAERFRKTVEAQSVWVSGIEITYSVSIGLSTMEHSITGLDELLQRADKALYHAKNVGRNCTKVYEETS